MTSALPSPSKENPVKTGLQVLGPGLITGASDDDPSGIATYSQAGAQFGFALGWTLLFTFPLMAAIQEISARIGRVTGKGLAGNMRQHTPRSLLLAIVALLAVANVVNLAADLAAMGAAVHLLAGGPTFLYAAAFAALSLAAQVFIGYARYASILKWMALSLLSYVATVLVVDVPWTQVARGLVLPEIRLSPEYFTMVVAILGTTISPYLFFWQASEEVEEIDKEHKAPLKRDARRAPQELSRIRLDTYLGMGLSNLVALFIVITAAATLHSSGAKEIQSAADAAEALRPLAGEFAFALFALGIVGTGALAVPVLAGATSYAVAETFGWRSGLNKTWRTAPRFYGTIAAMMAGGIVLNAIPIDPMKALFWSAVINGVLAVPIMGLMMFLGSSGKVMGQFVLPVGLKILGWFATTAMLTAAALMVLFGSMK